MTDPDRDLVLRCQTSQGSDFEAAYAELFALYKNRVFTICLRVTGNAEDALDASQETMLTLARRIRSFRFRSQFSSWVYRIAVNAAIDVRRRRLEGSHGSVSMVLANQDEDSGVDPPTAGEGSDPVLRVASEEARARVQEALAVINPRFSSLLVLRYVEGLSYEQIAEVMECSLGTVKSRLNRAHAALREHLARHGGLDPANP